jgi:LuxR family maltose regulon positive regulatory protein
MSTVDTRPPIGGHGVRPGVPPLPEPTVHPVRTLHRLTDAGGAVATVIEAPAGWGKTTLMTAWTQIARRVGRVAWLTVDPTDPPTTASWLADALAPYRVLPDGEEPVPGTHLVLIDDVQHLWSPAALAGLDDTILRSRPVVRFVLAGRGPLAALRRWRLSGHCLEAGPTDLAMDHADTRALLRAHRLDLADTAALRLHALTEGWPAGLDLAVRGAEPTASADWVSEDLGRYGGPAYGYVQAEILGGLSPADRDAFRIAAVAAPVNPHLLEALTGRRDAAAVLARLERDTGFVARRPGDENWYHLHPVVEAVLYAELRHDAPGRLRSLHATAARWHRTFGRPTEALRHALNADDRPAAAAILRKCWPELLATPRRLRAITEPPTPPVSTMDTMTVALAYAAERLDAGDIPTLRRLLQEAWVESSFRPVGGLARVSSAFRVVAGRMTGDLAAATAHGSPAAATVTSTADIPEALAIGAARLQSGNLAGAEGPLQAALMAAQRGQFVEAQVSAASHLAALEASRGRLHAATRAAELAQSTAERHGLTPAGELAWARLAMAEVCFQRDRLDDARRYAAEALDEGHQEAPALAIASIIGARVAAAGGDIGERVLPPASSHAVVDPALSAVLRRALLLAEAQLRLDLGDAATARLLTDWYDDPVCVAWAEVVEAAVLLAEHRPEPAGTLAARHLEGSSSATLTVHAGLITALAGQQLDDRTRILGGLEAALAVAEDEGHRRPFVAGGPAVRELLEAYGPGMPIYRPVISELVRTTPPRRPPQGNLVRAGLVEPLTDRELTVLRYLQDMLSNMEIAAALDVSVNTVKTHVKNIYRKLQAGRRREAVKRARQFRLL